MAISVWHEAGPDKGYSFVVLAALWIFSFVMFAPVRGSGVLYHSMMMSMDLTPEEVSWPFSLCVTVSSFSGISCGYLMQYFSNRQIILALSAINILAFILIFVLPLKIIWITISIGIFYGLAHGLTQTLLLVVPSEYFNAHHGIALGVTFTGIGVFGLLGPSLILTPIIEKYDIRGVFLLLGGLLSHSFLSAVLIRPRDDEHFASLRTSSHLTDAMDNEDAISISDSKPPRSCLEVVFPKEMKLLLKNKVFGLLSVASSFGEMAFFTFLAISVSTSVVKGISEEHARLAITTYSSGELISRFLCGTLLDKKKISAENLLTLLLIGMGVSLFIFGWATISWIILTSSFTFGLFFGGFFPARVLVIKRKFGVSFIPFAVGNIRIVIGVLNLLLPKLIGVLTGNDNRFDYVCFFFGGLCILSGLIWPIEKCMKSAIPLA